jgi:hypothetical protein
MCHASLANWCTAGPNKRYCATSCHADERMISDQPASPRAARLILSDAPHRAVSKIA